MDMKRHTLLMLACCLIPLAALVAVAVFNVPAGSVLTLGILVLCPLLHVIMMRGMMGHGHEDHDHHAALPTRSPMSQLSAGEEDKSA